MTKRRSRFRAGRIGLGFVLAVTAIASASVVNVVAVVVKPFEVAYQDVVYGDLLVTGNGNLRCPTAADGVSTRPGAANFANCANAQAGTIPASTYTNNNEWFMKQLDVDTYSTTFNSSSGSITIPADATIVYADLSWGGHTGQFKLGNGNTSTIPSCNVVGQQYPEFRSNLPPAPAVADPADQAVGLSIDGATPIEVTADSLVKDDGAAWPNSSDRLYTGTADVTSLLDGLVGGATYAITISNIWAPEGLNCTAGWSLNVVYAFDIDPDTVDFDTVVAPKQVTILNGHVRQGAAEPATTILVEGLNTVSNQARVGATAFEGDLGIVGDWLTVNGTRLNEPLGLGSTNDFFIGAADNSTDPGVKVNFSVDNGLSSTNLIPAGSTQATLATGTNGDGYILQGLQIVNDVPALLIRKTADIAQGHEGDTVTWTVEVRNPSGAVLHDVVVTDALMPGCNASYTQLTEADGVQTITCAGPLPDSDVTNSVSATGITDTGAEVTADSSATVEVLTPGISIEKTADRSFYLTGNTITFTILVENTGDTDLTDVEVVDPTVPACNRTIGTLLVGGQTEYTCTATAPIANDENTAEVSGEDPLGLVVDDESTAPAPIAAPAISVEKTVDSSVVVAGSTVTFDITVTNTGNMDLYDVTLTDALVAGCSANIGNLDVGEIFTTSCTFVTDDTDVTNVAEVEGTYPWCEAGEVGCTDPQVDDSDDVTVTVLEAVPGVVLEKNYVVVDDVNGNGINDAGDVIKWTFAVENSGNVTLENVSIDDPLLAGLGVGVTCNPSVLAAGASVVCESGAYTITEDDVAVGVIHNVATATGEVPAGTPGSPADPVSPPDEVIIPVEQTPVPGVVLEKNYVVVDDVNGNGINDAGDVIKWTFAVENSGNVTLENVSIDDPLLAGLGVGVTCNPSVLAAGASVVCESGAYTITEDDVAVGVIHNVATATGEVPAGTPGSPADPVSPPDDAIVELFLSDELLDEAALELEKIAHLFDTNDNKVANLGEKIQYTFVLTNTGNVRLTDVHVKDDLLKSVGIEVLCPKTTLLPGEKTVCTASQTYEVGEADVSAGTVHNIATGHGTDPDGNGLLKPPTDQTITTTGENLPITGMNAIFMLAAFILLATGSGVLLVARWSRTR